MTQQNQDNDRLRQIRDRILSTEEAPNTQVGCKCQHCTRARDGAAAVLAQMLVTAYGADPDNAAKDGNVSIVAFAIAPPSPQCQLPEADRRASVLKMLLLPGRIRCISDLNAMEGGLSAAFAAITETVAKHLGMVAAQAVNDGTLTREQAEQYMREVMERAVESLTQVNRRHEPPPSKN